MGLIPGQSFPWRAFALTSLTAGVVVSSYKAKQSPLTTFIWIFIQAFSLQIALFTIYRVILYPKFFSPLRHLPHPKDGSFINGQFWRILREHVGNMARDWNDTIPNNGLLYYTNLLNRERILVTGAKGLAEVLVQKSYQFIKPPSTTGNIATLLGVGILLAEGEEHKAQRKHLMPAFAFRQIKSLYPIFWSKSCELAKVLTSISQPEGTEPVQELKKAPVVELSSWISRAALDIIGIAGIGHDFNAIYDDTTELNRTYRHLFQPSRQAQFLQLLTFLIPYWLTRMIPIKRNSDVVEGARTIRRVCRQLIDQKKTIMAQQEKKETETDILSVALNSGAFTNEQLVDQLMTFLAAGHETSATATTWALHKLCKYPEIQSKLRAEIRSKLPSVDDTTIPFTPQLLDRIPYLHAVCNEVLRIHPPVGATFREAVHDTTIQGVFVPAGTRVVLAPQATNMSTQLWGAGAGEFKPERWMGEGRMNSGGAENNYAFMTFLHGPRSCIGQSFARAEFACLLAVIVGRFEFAEEDPDRVIELKGGITVRPKGGIPVHLRVVPGW